MHYELTLELDERADFDDVESHLGDAAPDAILARIAGRTLVAMDCEGDDPVAAAETSIMTLLAASIPVVRYDWDLVGVTEIANRVGRTRAAVAYWVNGARGPGNFPMHKGVVGGQKIWPWGDVQAWITENHVAEFSDRLPALLPVHIIQVESWLQQHLAKARFVVDVQA